MWLIQTSAVLWTHRTGQVSLLSVNSTRPLPLCPYHCISCRSVFSVPLSSGGHPTVPAKVQELAESLQQISGQLNTVLGALGSLAQRQSTTSYPAFHLPLSQPHSSPLTPAPTFSTSTSVPIMSQSLGPAALATPLPLRLSEPSWAWAPQGSSATAPLFSTPIFSGPRASEDLINSRWNQIFPGMSTAISVCLCNWNINTLNSQN